MTLIDLDISDVYRYPRYLLRRRSGKRWPPAARGPNLRGRPLLVQFNRCDDNDDEVMMMVLIMIMYINVVYILFRVCKNVVLINFIAISFYSLSKLSVLNFVCE